MVLLLFQKSSAMIITLKMMMVAVLTAEYNLILTVLTLLIISQSVLSHPSSLRWSVLSKKKTVISSL
jgi:hypothetical protein